MIPSSLEQQGAERFLLYTQQKLCRIGLLGIPRPRSG